jgi:alkylation response protein AidB-like acyl-CoA dehydrogenase
VQVEGLRVMFEGLNPERILGATLSTGLGRFALERAVSYVKDREVWGVPIGQHQIVAHPQAKARIELELAGLMMRKAAALYDAGSPLASEAANMAKCIAAEAGIRCIDTAVQVRHKSQKQGRPLACHGWHSTSGARPAWPIGPSFRRYPRCRVTGVMRRSAVTLTAARLRHDLELS